MKDDGGAAFARGHEWYDYSKYGESKWMDDGTQGMSLREYAAVSAMQGLLASGSHDCDQDGIAHDAVMHADALLRRLRQTA